MANSQSSMYGVGGSIYVKKEYTIFFVQFRNLGGVFSVQNNVIVALIPSRDRCQPRSWEASHRVKKQTIEDKGHIVGNQRAA